MRAARLKLVVLALGSRGDVQPFVALGRALQERGHRVCIATEQEYLGLADSYGLESACVGGSIRAQMDFEQVYQALDAAGRALPLGFALSFLRQAGPLVQRIIADSLAACQRADGILASTLGCYTGLSVSEKLGLPLLPVHFHPHAATGAYPDLSFAELPAGWPGRAAYNRLTHSLAAHGMWQLLRGALNQARRRVLGLPGLSARALWQRVRRPTSASLFAYSRHIAPPPADWTPRQEVCGYWFLPPEPGWQPPAELQRFLEAGPPPVYIGFGSLLAGRDPDQVTRLALEALDQAGQRGILYAGWGDFARPPLPPTCLRLEEAPHAWLFPRLGAAVTHCGAGTLAAALQAGLPVVGVPYFGDQLYWARRAHALGAAPPPIPRRQLSVARLAQAIRQVVDEPAYRQRARQLAALLSAEEGAQAGAARVEQAFQPSRPVLLQSPTP